MDMSSKSKKNVRIEDDQVAGDGSATTMPNQPDDYEATLQQLASEIDRVEDEKLEVTNQLKKALADYQNLERGIDNRVEMRLFQMKKKVAADLIEISDDMRFAVEASKSLELTDQAKAWLEGITGTARKMEKALGELGVVALGAEAGEKFDSSKHEAIAVVDMGGDNSVHEVVQEGYELEGMIIRPAKVVVNKKKSS